MNPAFFLPMAMGLGQSAMGLFGKQGKLNTIGNTPIMKQLLPMVQNQMQNGMSQGQEMMMGKQFSQGNDSVFNSQMANAKATQAPLAARSAMIDDASNNLFGATQNSANQVASADQAVAQQGQALFAQLAQLIGQGQVDGQNRFDQARGDMMGGGMNIIMQALNGMYPQNGKV